MNETQTLIADMANRLFASHVTPALIESSEKGVFPADLWSAFDDAGYPLLLNGGDESEITIIEALEVARAAGWHAAPGPLMETMIANSVIDACGLEPAAGPKSVIFFGLGANGENHFCPWATDVEEIVAVDCSGKQPRAAILKSKTVSTASPSHRLSEPRSWLSLKDDANIQWIHLSKSCSTLLSVASLLRAGQMLGALQWCLDRTVEYAQERSQFGRPIGKFQAIQQHIAALGGEVTACGAILGSAALAHKLDPDTLLVAAARSRFADAVDKAVWLSHQVHGAIGFSREYALNYRTRRLMAWRDEFGGAAYWRTHLATSFIAASADEIWPTLSKI